MHKQQFEGRTLGEILEKYLHLKDKWNRNYEGTENGQYDTGK